MGAKKLPPKLSRFSFLIIIFISVLALAYLVRDPKSPFGQNEDKMSFDQFVKYSEDKDMQIKEIRYLDAQSKIHGTLKDGKKFIVNVPKESKSIDDIMLALSKKGVSVNIEPPGFKESFGSLFYMIIVPALLFIGLWFLIMRQANMGGNQAMSFGRSRAKMLNEEMPKVTFADVAGVDEAKEELEEIIEFLKDPKRFQELGAKIPKGVLLVGPPGSGKTLLARAVAGEAKVPFFHMSGSDFVEMFVGVGASRVRDLFDQAKKHSPCLVFIDEIDAVGRQRGAGLGGGHDEREQTLNQLLVEMDGFTANVGVILIAATNRPDVLDPALLRPGRFDRRVVVDRPDVKGRLEILHVHARGKTISPAVNLEVIARRTPGFTGADLENVMNEAALLAARRNEKEITQVHIDEAIERNVAGPERKSRLLSDKARRITAFHESGHALVARLLPDTDPVHKISILPRGFALGYTLQLPLEDKYMIAKSELLNDICVLLGGRVAEELLFGHDNITTGASNDLEKVKKIARRMVCEFGMNENLGPLTFGNKTESIFLGRALAEERDYSEEVAFEIDQEIKKIVDNCYETTERLLKENMATLNLVAEKLLEKESLGGVLLESLLDGKDLDDAEVDRLEAMRSKEDEQKNIEWHAEHERKKAEAAEKAEAQSHVEKSEEKEAEKEPAGVAAVSGVDWTSPEAMTPEFPMAPEPADVSSSPNGIFGRLSSQLQDALMDFYRPQLERELPKEPFAAAEDFFFAKKEFEHSLQPINKSIKACRDQSLVPGLRIMLGLAYLKLGNIERVSDELMAALMAAPGKLEKNIEQILVSSISYFRILNEELKTSRKTLDSFLTDDSALQKVDRRFVEWERRTGMAPPQTN